MLLKQRLRFSQSVVCQIVNLNIHVTQSLSFKQETHDWNDFREYQLPAFGTPPPLTRGEDALFKTGLTVIHNEDNADPILGYNVTSKELYYLNTRFYATLLHWLNQLNTIHGWGLDAQFHAWDGLISQVDMTYEDWDATSYSVSGYPWHIKNYFGEVRSFIEGLCRDYFGLEPTNNWLWNSHNVSKLGYTVKTRGDTASISVTVDEDDRLNYFKTVKTVWSPEDLAELGKYGKYSFENFWRLLPGSYQRWVSAYLPIDGANQQRSYPFFAFSFGKSYHYGKQYAPPTDGSNVRYFILKAYTQSTHYYHLVGPEPQNSIFVQGPLSATNLKDLIDSVFDITCTVVETLVELGRPVLAYMINCGLLGYDVMNSFGMVHTSFMYLRQYLDPDDILIQDNYQSLPITQIINNITWEEIEENAQTIIDIGNLNPTQAAVIEQYSIDVAYDINFNPSISGSVRKDNFVNCIFTGGKSLRQYLGLTAIETTIDVSEPVNDSDFFHYLNLRMTTLDNRQFGYLFSGKFFGTSPLSGVHKVGLTATLKIYGASVDFPALRKIPQSNAGYGKEVYEAIKALTDDDLTELVAIPVTGEDETLTYDPSALNDFIPEHDILVFLLRYEDVVHPFADLDAAFVYAQSLGYLGKQETDYTLVDRLTTSVVGNPPNGQPYFYICGLPVWTEHWICRPEGSPK